MNFRKYQEPVIAILSLVILFKLWRWDNANGRNDYRIIPQTDLTEIKVKLASKPSIDTDGEESRVSIKATEFPMFKFDARGIKYSAIKSHDFVNELSKGDTVYLSILTYDYETKITKEKPLRRSEKIFSYSVIEPYSIQSNGKYYMTLADVNLAWNDHRDMSKWMFRWLLGIASVTGLIYSILHFTGFNRRFVKWVNDIQASQ